MIAIGILLLIQPVPEGNAPVSPAIPVETASIASGEPADAATACDLLSLYLAELDRHDAEARAVLAGEPSADGFDQALERLALVSDGRTYVSRAWQQLCPGGN